MFLSGHAWPWGREDNKKGSVTSCASVKREKSSLKSSAKNSKKKTEKENKK